jgi:hypothetical protein
VRTRKSEADAVKAALEGEYESADQAAQAVWDVVVAELAKRNSYGVGIRLSPDGVVLGFGPFWDRGSATRFGTKMPGSAVVQQLFSPANVPNTEDDCPECGHNWIAHLEGGCVIGFDARLPARNQRGDVRNPGCGCKAVKGTLA